MNAQINWRQEPKNRQVSKYNKKCSPEMKKGYFNKQCQHFKILTGKTKSDVSKVF